jgi:hypothetical protein
MYQTGSRWIGTAIVTAVISACDRQPSVPIVECRVTYGGESHSFTVSPTSKPYREKPVNIEDRFGFKAQMVMESDNTWLLNLYTSSRSGKGTVLIHEMKTALKPPFAPSVNESAFGFTGRQFVYDSIGRELSYHCGYRLP